MLQNIGFGVLGVILAGVLVVHSAGRGCFGSHEGPGTVRGVERSAQSVADAETAIARAGRGVGVSRPKQVLFGDLHVHTTFSFDAFMFSLPMAGGEGAHPPADACDFARYCSALDFWSVNDHAFSVSPRHWRETVESIRQCNAVAQDARNPDTVAFLGWEWTQVGTTPESHYGHKNVVLAHTDDARIPARPIAAQPGLGGGPGPMRLGIGALLGGGRLHDLARYYAELSALSTCAEGVDSRELPADCIEQAPTPADLFRKLDEWGTRALVIPHGTTWGFYTPPGGSWDKQLRGRQHDPARQRLLEVYSGHGDSEVVRPWRAVEFDASGTPICPEPRDDYLPSCWRAGELIRARCLEAGEDEAECDERAVEARAHAAAAGVAVHRTVPGARASDWLDAGQCRDCDEPSFNYRPGGSAQYILALGNFEGGSSPRRFRTGLMASSDNHFARAGTGYKEVHRLGMTESGLGDVGPLLGVVEEEPTPQSRPFRVEQPGFDVFETERQGSFLLTGGLVAVHAGGRDREAIWRALENREVYGTSGPRILLWFDLLNAPGSRGRSLPMGGEVRMQADPIFQVRAVGSFQQQPGCPEASRAALSASAWSISAWASATTRGTRAVRSPGSRSFASAPSRAPASPSAPWSATPGACTAVPRTRRAASTPSPIPSSAPAVAMRSTTRGCTRSRSRASTRGTCAASATPRGPACAPIRVPTRAVRTQTVSLPTSPVPGRPPSGSTTPGAEAGTSRAAIRVPAVNPQGSGRVFQHVPRPVVILAAMSRRFPATISLALLAVAATPAESRLIAPEQLGVQGFNRAMGSRSQFMGEGDFVRDEGTTRIASENESRLLSQVGEQRFNDVMGRRIENAGEGYRVDTMPETGEVLQQVGRDSARLAREAREGGERVVERGRELAEEGRGTGFSQGLGDWGRSAAHELGGREERPPYDAQRVENDEQRRRYYGMRSPDE